MNQLALNEDISSEAWTVGMSSSVEDLQMLRLIKAYQKIIEPNVRRMIVLFVEEQAQKQGAEKPKDHPDGR